MNFDPNAWYRLDTVLSNGTRALRWCSNQIVCFSDQNLTDFSAQWQLSAFGAQPSSTTTGSAPASTTSSASSSQSTISLVSIRNRQLGSSSAVAVFAAGNETQVGMRPLSASSDPAQLWNFVFLDRTSSGDPIYIVKNVANTTSYNMAATNDTVYMTRQLYVTGNDQGWVVSLVREEEPTSSDSPSATGSSTPSSDGRGVSAGAIAGAVTGSVIGLAFLIVLALVIVRRRRARRRPKISNPIPIDPDSQEGTNQSGSTTIPISETEAKKEKENVDGRVELPTDSDQVSFRRYELA